MSERKKTVLIIDDSAYMRGLIGDIFKRNGYRVIGEAENGKVGVEKYKLLRPDIVTTDIIMDEESGLSALEHILECNPNAFVVIISSMTEQSWLAAEAMKKGAKDVLTKPVDEVALITAVKSVT